MTARRILICLHDFSRGGTERVALGLAAAWAGAGREVTILCGAAEGGLRDSLDASVRLVALEPPVRRSALSRFRLGAAMARQVPVLEPDVIFLPGNFHALLANVLRKADPRPKIALKISNPPLPAGLPFAALLFRHVTRSVDGFAAMNGGLARQLQAMLPGRNIVTLHDPVYIGEGARVSRPDRGCQILWIGRLEPQKDPGLALDVIAAMSADVHLTMLGEGALARALERRILREGLKGKVTLKGHVPQIEPYLAEAHALLITSRYEGGPAVAVEALASGVPVVATDCSFLLHDLLTQPRAGRIVASREPKHLAAALAAVCAPGRETEGLKALAAPFAPGPRARAYLGWFDAMVDRE